MENKVTISLSEYEEMDGIRKEFAKKLDEASATVAKDAKADMAEFERIVMSERDSMVRNNAELKAKVDALNAKLFGLSVELKGAREQVDHLKADLVCMTRERDTLKDLYCRLGDRVDTAGFFARIFRTW